MAYRESSGWNERNEMKCLLLFKKLLEENFKRGLQEDYCRSLATKTQLKLSSIKAKVGNYKSVAGITGRSHASKNTKEVFRLYGHLTVQKLTDLIDSQGIQKEDI